MAFALAVAAGTAVGCGDGSGSEETANAPSASARIGPAGGKLTSPEGVVLEIPEGALDTETEITITLVEDAPPPELTAVGPAFDLGPPGLQFRKIVLLKLPVDPTRVTAAKYGVAVASAPDGSQTYLRQPAAPSDDTHVVTTLGHFSRWMPIAHSPHCRDAAGDLELELCGVFGCPPRYHSTAIQFVVEECGPGIQLRSKCERDDALEYATCATIGCNAGYHWAPNTVLEEKNALAFCEIGTYCAVNAGPDFLTCEFGCPEGYRAEGTGGLVKCPWFDALGRPSLRCVAVSSPPPNACSRQPLYAADPHHLAYSEYCADESTYAIGCDCGTGACDCWRDSQKTKTGVSLACADLGTSGYDALREACGFPLGSSCPAGLVCEPKSLDAGSTEGGAVDATADSGSSFAAPPPTRPPPAPLGPCEDLPWHRGRATDASADATATIEASVPDTGR